MEPPSEHEWASIAEHTRASNCAGGLIRLPPYPMMLAVRSIVGSIEAVTASHTLVRWAPTTAWQAWLFTSHALAFVECIYPEPNYDYDEDNGRRTQTDAFDKPLDPDSFQAWVRPTTTVSKFGIGAAHYVRKNRPFREPSTEYYPTSIDLVFSDGTSTAIGLDGRLDHQDKRERWERFCNAARHSVIATIRLP
ncbi:hypothetical protein CRI77_14785 [Mycolicibacterium duvalii]|uniref:Uncharacterized protein n=2 Tax=Mycolicibacterium duvalii TaxID=39688 RepID=A0A7I7K5P3_9MYCO|nr:hypothetical protein CRI77_14785 [Mycolicibacterium duvalii]BBX19460.1 hypothetical protein MDUV_43200 [Mycolicibacterium duvalii]